MRKAGEDLAAARVGKLSWSLPGASKVTRSGGKSFPAQPEAQLCDLEYVIELL